MTLRSIKREEATTVRRVQDGRNTRMRLGAVDGLPEKLTRGQRHAAKQLLLGRDFLSLLVGDAGTGKTTVLSAIEGAHVAAGGADYARERRAGRVRIR
jgi:RecG-like helicase